MSWLYQADPSITSLPALVSARTGALDKTFIRNADGRDFSFADFWTLSGRIARALAEAGVEKGDRVAVQVEKSPEVIALFLACARAGAIFLPLNTAYTLAELDYFVGDAEPKIIVVAPERVSALADLAARHNATVLSLGVAGDGTLMDAANAGDGAFADAKIDWDDLVAILYTSGTTGRSKGAMLTHGNLASNALALVDIWRFTSGDTLLHALPIYHTHGLFTATNTLMLSGGTMIFRPKFDADEALRAAAGDRHDGRADLLHAAAPRIPASTREATATCGSSSPARRRFWPRRMPNSRPHRPRHPRALRHDRDQHEHLQSL
jgi:malonyl-CoA/methylmalonyl-CoA synthetase